jgi:hypothetical protein
VIEWRLLSHRGCTCSWLVKATPHPQSDAEPGGSPAVFATTHWSVVINTWRDIMSCHPQQILDILTSDQLARMTMESNGLRFSAPLGAPDANPRECPRI